MEKQYRKHGERVSTLTRTLFDSAAEKWINVQESGAGEKRRSLHPIPIDRYIHARSFIDSPTRVAEPYLSPFVLVSSAPYLTAQDA
jgi:hypothetical protein